MRQRSSRLGLVDSLLDGCRLGGLGVERENLCASSLFDLGSGGDAQTQDLCSTGLLDLGGRSTSVGCAEREGLDGGLGSIGSGLGCSGLVTSLSDDGNLTLLLAGLLVGLIVLLTVGLLALLAVLRVLLLAVCLLSLLSVCLVTVLVVLLLLLALLLLALLSILAVLLAVATVLLLSVALSRVEEGLAGVEGGSTRGEATHASLETTTVLLLLLGRLLLATHVQALLGLSRQVLVLLGVRRVFP
jgi:hypothetical protein